MPTIGLLDDLYLVLGALVPGLIALFIRGQFVTGRSQPHGTAVLSYVTVSVVYYALALPVLDMLSAAGISRSPTALTWFALVFVGPAVFGLLLGISSQQGILRRILRRLHLNPVHVMPTAWDWKFGSMAPHWVLVTLKDGTQLAGFCGEDSFASSDPSERDLYIQWIYDVDDAKIWTSRGSTGVLITAGEIKTVEFWPFVPEETSHEQT